MAITSFMGTSTLQVSIKHLGSPGRRSEMIYGQACGHRELSEFCHHKKSRCLNNFTSQTPGRFLDNGLLIAKLPFFHLCTIIGLLALHPLLRDENKIIQRYAKPAVATFKCNILPSSAEPIKYALIQM